MSYMGIHSSRYAYHESKHLFLPLTTSFAQLFNVYIGVMRGLGALQSCNAAFIIGNSNCHSFYFSRVRKR